MESNPMISLTRIVLYALFAYQLSLIGFLQSRMTAADLNESSQNILSISTIAGNGTKGFSGDGGPATLAQMDAPVDVAVDMAGNLFIADTWNNRIRKVTSKGIISTVAGNGTKGFSGDGGLAVSAMLNAPHNLAVDREGNLFITDLGNYRIRKVTPSGVIATVAGNGTGGFSEDGGPAVSAMLSSPCGIAVDIAGNLFIAEIVDNRIRKVAPGGMISTVAGNGTKLKTGLVVSNEVIVTKLFSGDGGPAISAMLHAPQSVAVDTAGNLFIADTYNNRIRKVASDSIITTVAGNGTAGFSGDGGSAASAQLAGPTAIAVDTAGNMFIAADHRIRKVTPDGTITTVAGIGTAGFSGDGGPAASAELSYPSAVAVDTMGNLFIAEWNNNRIRKVTQGRGKK
jgi:sugar lactone lactonase YvrE